MIYTTQAGPGVFGRVDDLHLNRRERLRVNAYMQDGEFIAELICRALALVHAGAAGLARAVKLLFATSVKH